jgi:hypothetical protein
MFCGLEVFDSELDVLFPIIDAEQNGNPKENYENDE